MTSTLAFPQITDPRPIMRCVIYLRISKDSLGLGLGVDRQRSECVQLAAGRGWEVIAVLEENDTSATTGRGDRKEYRKLLGMIGRGEVDIVLSWAQDRLLREPLEMEALIELAETHPFTIEGVVDRGTDLATASGRKAARNNVADAKGENERKSERQRSANLQRAMAGRPPVRRAFGYAKDGSIIEAEAAEVRSAFNRYVAGAGSLAIMRDWNDRGVFNTAGGPWSQAGFRTSILRNPRYIAERWMDRRSKDGRRTTSTYVGPGDWEPLIDEDTFRAAAARLDALVAKADHGGAKKHLGSGLYLCGSCADGSGVAANYQQARPGPDATRTLVYICAKTRRTLGAAEPIDLYVKTEIVQYLRQNRLSDLMADDRNIKAVRASRDKVAALRLRRRGFDDALAEGDLKPAEFRKAADSVDVKIETAEKELAALGTRSALALLEGAVDPGATWRDLAVIERSKVAGALATVTVRRGAGGRHPFDPSSVTIEWTKRSD